MKKSYKAIVGLSLLVSTMLYSTSLEDYLKEYEPKEYEALMQDGIDIKELEVSSPKSNQEEASSSIRSSTISDVSVSDISAKRLCESNGGVFLNNKIITTCVSEDGTFGNGYNPVGITFQGADFLRPGTPFEFFSLQFTDDSSADVTYYNNNAGGGNIPTTISALNRFDSKNGGAMVDSHIYDGTKRLEIVQKYTLDPNSKELILRVELSNVGKSSINNLYYARGLDPDQDIGSSSSTYQTYNQKGGFFGGLKVSTENLVQAIGITTKLAVGLYSVDEIAHDTCVKPSWSMSPIGIISCMPPLYTNLNSDSTINIAFNLGTLHPREKKVFSFKYLFEKKKKRKRVIDSIESEASVGLFVK